MLGLADKIYMKIRIYKVTVLQACPGIIVMKTQWCKGIDRSAKIYYLVLIFVCYLNFISIFYILMEAVMAFVLGRGR